MKIFSLNKQIIYPGAILDPVLKSEFHVDFVVKNSKMCFIRTEKTSRIPIAEIHENSSPRPCRKSHPV